jgi:hypothetical protein
VRIRKFDGLSFWGKNKRISINKDDVIVCWGDAIPSIEGLTIMNGGGVPNKYQTALRLAESGVPTVTVYHNGTKDPNKVYTLSHEVWLPRKNDHVGGNDLITPTTNPDYWSAKKHFVNEYRVHSFMINKKPVSVRAGKKALREGFTLNPEEVSATVALASSWIRSFDAGWRIVYDNFQTTKAMRLIAHQAIAALKLDFGAVDIGETSDGKLYVLEVNRAPGLEGNSITTYASAITRWMNAARGIQADGGGGGEYLQPGGEKTRRKVVNAFVDDAEAGQAPVFNGAAAAQPVNPLPEQPAAPAAAQEPPVGAARGAWGGSLLFNYEDVAAYWNNQPGAAAPNAPNVRAGVRAVPNNREAVGRGLFRADAIRRVERAVRAGGAGRMRVPFQYIPPNNE